MTQADKDIWNAAVEAAAQAIADQCGLLAPYKRAHGAVKSVKKGKSNE
mgnify:CR=1 FL=1